MKANIGLVCLIILFSKPSFAQSNNRDYILALSVELYMNTIFSVPCDNFATMFKSSLHAGKISNADTLAMFSSFVRKVKYARHDRGIDVRRKFIYELNGVDTTIICSNEFDILVHGRLIKRNKRFMTFLNSMVR